MPISKIITVRIKNNDVADGVRTTLAKQFGMRTMVSDIEYNSPTLAFIVNRGLWTGRWVADFHPEHINGEHHIEFTLEDSA